MAYYAALASLMELLDDIIDNDRYPNFLLGEQPITNTLREKFRSLQESLNDYSSRGDKDNDRVEGRIRDVAYRAQDVIEFAISDQIEILRKSDSDRYVENLQKLQREVDLLVQEIMVIKERQRVECSKLKPNCDYYFSSEAPPAVDGTAVVGFDDYLTTIKDQLSRHSSQLRVIRIVGMGGIGKTTLAQSAFEDALSSYRFDIRGWVTVSQDYNRTQVYHSIMKSMAMPIHESLRWQEAEELKDRIYKHLKGRRYLVVMDDVWSKKVWDDARRMFPEDSNGSRIMVTTRLLDIAQYIGTSGFLHRMRFLDKDQSWSLLREKVFGKEPCPPELIYMGKCIARKCGGLPLAIVVMAGILSRDKTLPEWTKIAAAVNATLSEIEDERLRGILSLSYNHLPHQLKACYMYMGGCPEDYEMSIPKLVKLWIAEGLLKNSDESKSLEKVGEECVEDLVARNLVLITKKRSSGQFKNCILHDVLREFCRQRAFHERFLHITQKNGYLYPSGVENIRRINLDSGHNIKLGLHNAGNLVRSILCFSNKYYSDLRSIDWNSFKLFKVLDLSRIEAESNLDKIFEMLHLKYLECLCSTERRHRTQNYIRESLFTVLDRRTLYRIPESLSTLENLQTLVINSSQTFRIVELPLTIWKMTQLRHLIADRMILPRAEDITLQKLGSLQTLMTTLDFKFTDDAIQMIPNLRKLKIVCSRDNPGCLWEFFCLHNLVRLQVLEELKIRFDYVLDPISLCDGPAGGNIPHHVAFPTTLRKLSLRGCRAPWEDLAVAGSLPNLQVLRLEMDSFVGEEWIPLEGQFLSLKFLLLEHLDIEFWLADSAHFPCLEHLTIKECSRLQKIPLEIGDIPTLKFIDVYRSELVEDSAVQIREDQQNLGNDVLQVRILRY
ncbi:late blight resistance protein R1-A-like [Andrographis paniculata]|uniref:late blight resistance protein R1-A-like n=1 Tax=Andrographis paniculata TaxID=175694 RepID=UPI0021E7B269|nr:late blight resistance protein R1-A-like [Andrographis paniculata]